LTGQNSLSFTCVPLSVNSGLCRARRQALPA
jgi:hypothetical protein